MTDEQRKSLLENFREAVLTEKVNSYKHFLNSLFWGVINYVVPSSFHGSIEEFIQSSRKEFPVLANFEYQNEGRYTNLSDYLNEVLQENPEGLSEDRVHELKAAEWVINRSRAPLVLCCVEKFLVRDSFNKPKDEWDGVIIEVFKDKLNLLVVEAKNKRQVARRESEAFKQLMETKKIVSAKSKLKYRRKKIPQIGAVITFEFSGL